MEIRKRYYFNAIETIKQAEKDYIKEFLHKLDKLRDSCHEKCLKPVEELENWVNSIKDKSPIVAKNIAIENCGGGFEQFLNDLMMNSKKLTIKP